MELKLGNRLPLIIHVIHKLGVGGLENGLVNLINHSNSEKYMHAVVCLTDSTDFRSRITAKHVQIFHLNKKPGQDWMSFIRFFRLLKKLQPSIVHTRNLGTIEYQIPSFLAGVKHRVHGEHGWDIFDPLGENKKYQWLRRILKVFIHRFIPLSRHLENYLTDVIKVPQNKITRICNGVDTSVFNLETKKKKQLEGCPFNFDENLIFIGTVGRMHGVKDQLTLVSAFIKLVKEHPDLEYGIRLMIIGDGPLRGQAKTLLAKETLSKISWLPGERSDISEIMKHLDIFVLPSTAEGISNTILEAMATGLPVIATDVGGNPELVQDKVTGLLTPKSKPDEMVKCLLEYIKDKKKRQDHGVKARQVTVKHFSINKMVADYESVYDYFLD